MAGYNGTGPRGEGPLTGRGMGYCNSEREDVDYQRFERGRGMGRGFGRGRKVRFEEPQSQEIVYGLGRGGIPRGRGRFFRGRGLEHRLYRR